MIGIRESRRRSFKIYMISQKRILESTLNMRSTWEEQKKKNS